MSQPSAPYLMYLDRYGGAATACDPQLPARALQYRIQKGLMEPGDFYRNITVWKLVHDDKRVEYLERENDSDEAGFEQAVQVRIKAGMKPGEARKDAKAYPTNSGLHSEVNLVAEIYRRPDISSQKTAITQVFTERSPCHECQTFMRNMFPVVLGTPFYYYLSGNRSTRKDQMRSSGGNVMLYLLSRYGA